MNFLSKPAASAYPTKEESLTALSRLKDGMLGKDHDILLAAINAGYGFIRMDDGGPIITIDHSLKKRG